MRLARPACLAVVLALVTAPFAWGAEGEIAQLLRELKGEAKAPVRTPQQLQAAHAKALAALLPKFASKDRYEQQEAQRAYTAICWHAGRAGAEAERAAACRAILAELKPGLAKPALVFLIEKLGQVGREDAVDALASLLGHKDLAPPPIRERARQALVSNPSAKALAALRRALGRATEAKWQVGLVNALGARRDGAAVPALIKLARAGDEAVRSAALAALGRIGDKGAAQVLAAAARSASGPARRAAIVSYLVFAEQLCERDDKTTALTVYRSLLDAKDYVKCGALVGVGRAGGADELPVIFAALADADAEIRAAALAALDLMPLQHVQAAIARKARTATPQMKALLLEVLAKRGDKTALPTLIASAADPNEVVRIAAYKSMGKLADGGAVPTLVAALATAQGRELDAVKTAVNRIPGAAATDALIAAMAGADARVRAELVRVLGHRKDDAAVPALLKAAEDQDAGVRAEALKAAGGYAGESALAGLIALLVKAGDDRGRQAAAKAIAAVCGRVKDEATRARPLLAALPRADVPARCSLLAVLARTGAPKALEALRAATKDAEPKIQDAAIRALADWPDARSAGDLLALARSSEGLAHHVLALRGYVRVVGLTSDRPATDTLRMYAEAMKAARRTEEKKAALAGIAQVKSLAALKQVEPYLADAALQGEAAAAMVKIATAISGAHKEEAKGALEQLLKTAPSESVRKQAREGIAQIEKFEDYVTAWLYAAPYTMKGKGGPQLHNVVFPPEKEPEKVTWKVMPAGACREMPWAMDLGRVLGGNDRAAYFRTHVWSPKKQPVLLEFGSDDGSKLWLNGKMIHEHPQPRSMAPASDKLKLTLEEGWNALLVKVWNGGGDWRICARFRKPDGTKLEGLRARLRPE